MKENNEDKKGAQLKEFFLQNHLCNREFTEAVPITTKNHILLIFVN